MKFSLALSSLVVVFLGHSLVSAQTNVVAMVSNACTINPGYTMADVVATARNFEWSDETAPGLVLLRRPVASTRPAGATRQFDFIFDSVFPSYADMVEKQGAFLQEEAAQNGRRRLDGVATCGDNPIIRSGRFAAVAPGGPGSIQPLFPTVTTFCELNGATVADALTMAGGIAENFESGAGVMSPGFGGRSRPFNSRVRLRFFFSSFDEFGASWDRIQQNAPVRNPDNPISCEVPSLWATYRIHARSN